MGPTGSIELTQRPPDDLVAAAITQAHIAWPEPHFGRDRTLYLLRGCVSWPTMSEDVARFVRNCTACQFNARKPDSPADLLTTPTSAPLDCVQLDFIGPLQRTTKGNQYVFCIVDRFSRFTVLVPIPALDAQTVTDAFIRRWVAYLGVPTTIISDGGPPFTSTAFGELMKSLNATLRVSLPLAPQGHGLVERTNSTVVSTLRAILQHHHHSVAWDTVIEQLQLSINAHPNRVSGLPPFTAIHGFPVRLPLHIVTGVAPFAVHTTEPLDFALHLYNSLREAANLVALHDRRAAIERRKAFLDANAGRPKAVYDTGTFVLVHKPRDQKLHPEWAGPYQVVGPGRNTASYLLRDLLNEKEFECAASRMRTFLPGRLSKEEMAAISAPPTEFVVEGVTGHLEAPLRFWIKWKGSPLPTLVPWEDCSNTSVVMKYMREKGIKRPRKAQADRH